MSFGNMMIDYTNPSADALAVIDVHDLLPQREPFVMIGSLVHFDMKRTETKTFISESNIFVDNGIFSATGLMENVAQTCAVRIGYINKYILKKGIQIGVIGSIRNFEINSLPKIGDTISTTIDVRDEIFGMILADCKVMIGDDVVATTEIKIAVTDKEV